MSFLLAFLVGISDLCATNGMVSASGFFSQALAAAGHDSVVICRTTDTNALRRVVRGLDLVLLTGGVDVAPQRYGVRPSPKLGPVWPWRDEYDFALVAACRAEGKPMLGICRGHQLLNVAFGGTLVQDIPTEYEPPAGKPKIAHGPFKWADSATNPPGHDVTFVPGTRLARLWGDAPLAVASFHHQAVGRLAPGFRVAARSPDGLVEAFEHESLPVYGMQFHPEQTAAVRPQTGFDLERHAMFFRRLPELFR